MKKLNMNVDITLTKKTFAKKNSQVRSKTDNEQLEYAHGQNINQEKLQHKAPNYRDLVKFWRRATMKLPNMATKVPKAKKSNT